MSGTGIIVLAIGAGVVLLFVVVRFARSVQTERAREVMARFEGRKVHGVSSNANFFGQQSKGAAQLRGNGVLVLSDDELYYEMWAPKRSLAIPHGSILGAEAVRSFLGKSRGSKLLKVTFRNEAGEEDAAAWLVNNLDHWLSAIAEIAKRDSPAGERE